MPGYVRLKARDFALPLAILIAALTAVGYTAWRATRAQRDSDRTLRRMYATTATAFIAERLDLSLGALADMAIVTPRGPVDAAFVDRSWRFADSIFTCGCTKLPKPLAAFAVAPEGLIVHGDTTATLADVRDAVRTLYASGMPMSRRDSNLVLHSLVSRGRPLLVMARAASGPPPRRYVGIVADATTLDPRLLEYRDHAVADPSFLEAISRGTGSVATATPPWDSLLAFVVTTPDGQPFARSATSIPDAVLDVSLPARGGGFAVQGWMSPRAGPMLLSVVAPTRSGDIAVVSLLGIVLILALFVLLLRAAALARLRQQLALGVTHELRTPLTQILLYAETLAMGRARSPEVQEKAVGVIVRETQLLIDAVDNVLHHTKAEQRELTATPEPIDLATFVSDVMPMHASSHAAIAIDPGTRVVADRRLLTRVIVNVVDNAMKHGGGHIAISSRRNDGGVEILFDDNGPGIPSRLRRRVFAPFFRADDARTRPGFGMGLALVNEAMQAMGGTVTIDDAPSGGARVRASLPADEGVA